MARFRGTTFHSLHDLSSSWPSSGDLGAEFDRANLARRLSELRTAEARELREATQRREAKTNDAPMPDNGEINGETGCNGYNTCQCLSDSTQIPLEAKAAEIVLLSVARELIGLVGDLRVGESWDESRRRRLWAALAAADVVVGAEIGGRAEQ